MTNVTIKNVKYSEFASHETLCFECSVYINGKRACCAENAGQGGSTNIFPVTGDNYAEMYRKTGIAAGERTEEELERDVDDAMFDWLLAKDLRRALKQVLYYRPDENAIYDIPAKYKPVDKVFDMVRASSWWQRDFVLLNTLPFEEAFTIFKTTMMGED